MERNRQNKTHSRTDANRIPQRDASIEQGFDADEEANFATEPDIMAGDQFETEPGEEAMKAEQQNAMEGEEGVRQAGEQWPQGDETADQIHQQAQEARQHKAGRRQRLYPRSHRNRSQ